MDHLDVEIIRHLFFSPWPFQWTLRRPYAHVAREIGVTDDTVRSRVRRMQEEGFLLGGETVVNPTILNRQLITMDVSDVDPQLKEDVTEVIRLLDGVRWIYDLDDGLRISFFQQSGPPFDRLVQIVSKLCRSRPDSWSLPVPPATRTPSPADWRLIAALRRDSRLTVKKLESRTGMSRRTVQRRLSRLIGGRSIFTSPVLDLGRLEGTVFVMVRIASGPGGDMEQVRRALPAERCLASSVAASEALAFYILQDAGEAERLANRLRVDLGEDRVHVDICRRRITCHTWIDEVVQTHLPSDKSKS